MRFAVLLGGLMTTLACSSSSSSSSSTCDAGACAAIAMQISQNGGGPGACVEPTTHFEAACQAYQTCLKQCGQ